MQLQYKSIPATFQEFSTKYLTFVPFVNLINMKNTELYYYKSSVLFSHSFLFLHINRLNDCTIIWLSFFIHPFYIHRNVIYSWLLYMSFKAPVNVLLFTFCNSLYSETSFLLYSRLLLLWKDFLSFQVPQVIFQFILRFICFYFCRHLKNKWCASLVIAYN